MGIKLPEVVPRSAVHACATTVPCDDPDGQPTAKRQICHKGSSHRGFVERGMARIGPTSLADKFAPVRARLAVVRARAGDYGHKASSKSLDFITDHVPCILERRDQVPHLRREDEVRSLLVRAVRPSAEARSLESERLGVGRSTSDAAGSSAPRLVRRTSLERRTRRSRQTSHRASCRAYGSQQRQSFAS